MDPSSISSPAPPPNTVPFAVEPNNHPPPPLPQPLPSPSSNHPPYAEMIYTAIEALKEKEGSSKRAISKYIEQVYKDQLPNSESHQSLLTHHLKRLKSEGLLQMIKNSYIIPRSGPLPPSPPPTASPSPSSRPRGRPRKAQAQAQTPQAQDNVINPPPQPFPVVVVSSNNNNISPVAAAQTQAQQNASAEPVWAALGLTDEPAAVVTEGSKRRPGRPKKGLGSSPSPSQGGIQQLSPTPSRGRGRPPGSKSKSKKRPGRPPKIQPGTQGSGSASAGVVGDVSGGSKRRPGRPAKNQQQNPTVIPFAAPVPEVVVPIAEGGVAVLTPRSRGRPRKNANAVAAVPVAVVAAAGRGRGRGRGRGGVAGRGRGGGRGRGRPRINLLARPAGRPVGRPKKGTTPATASAPENAANEEDLRRKLEHFQVKVKESLAVLRPHFNHESPVTAIAAIQELDILVAMDLNEPLKDDTLPLQQNLPAQEQPQPPPQLQQQQPPQQQQQPLQQPPQQLLPQHLPPQQIVAQPQLFPQYPPFQTQEYHFQQQHPQLYQPPQLYQQPPPQQNQFHP